MRSNQNTFSVKLLMRTERGRDMMKLVGAKFPCESAKMSFKPATSSDAKENINMFAMSLKDRVADR
jgi:hypothetical protein